MAVSHDIRTDLLDEARAAVETFGDHLAWYDGDGELQLVRLHHEWIRVGRSLAADVHLDDPSVRRRHALLVRDPDAWRVWFADQADGWHELRDGDVLEIGRFRLVFVRHH